MNFTKYGIENDMWYKKREHIYYLMGIDVGAEYIVATYSLKTKRLLIKYANECIPATHILREFVDYCEKKGENK